MTLADLFKQYLEHLFRGRRSEARRLLLDAQDRGMHASKLLTGIIWPAMEQVSDLYRYNHISRIVEHMATRINRLVADQLQGLLATQPKTGQRMVVVCGEGESEELSAQITADLFEADGWAVWFLGSGVPNDETVQFLAHVTPDILCVFGTAPQEAPAVRKLIDLIREVGICEDMQVLVGGGVFNRAEGLAEEIHADIFARNALEALELVGGHPERVAAVDIPEPGRRRKRKSAASQAAAADLRRAIDESGLEDDEVIDDAITEAVAQARMLEELDE